MTQTIPFTWTPRSFSVSQNSPIKYKLKIVKLDPVGTSPYVALDNSTFLVNNSEFIDISGSYFAFDPSNFQLESGKTYAWQVLAYEEKLINGALTQSSARFKNGGKSQAYTFKTEENCPSVEEIQIEEQSAPTGSLLALSWLGDDLHQQYELSYRIAGSNSPWQIIKLSQSSAQLSSNELLRGQVYEYTLKTRCNNWLDEAQTGELKLSTQSCTAPTPILIADNDPTNGITLTWDATTDASTYLVTYTDNNTSTTQTEEVTNPTVTIPALSQGIYTLQVDAQCTASTALGQSQTLKFDDSQIVEACPLARPFSLYAIPLEAAPSQTEITWASLAIHKSFEFTYWDNSKPSSAQTLTATEAKLTIPGLTPAQLYRYTLKSICTDTKTVTTPEGGFRLAPIEEEVITDPTTADCFPPKVISAEVRNPSTAKFDWEKIKDAESYELSYTLQTAAGETPASSQLFTTTSTNAKVKDLSPGTYTYSLKVRCGDKLSIPSSEGTIDMRQSQSNADCDSLPAIEVLTTTDSEAQLAWSYTTGLHTGFTIQYKEKDQHWGESYTTDLNDLQDLVANHKAPDSDKIRYTIPRLRSSKTYHFKLTGKCGIDQAQSNDVLIATTTAERMLNCEAGGACDRTSTIQIGTLALGDEIKISTYTLKISKITSQSPLFTGEATGDIEILGKSDAVQAVFALKDAFINESACVTKGEASFTSVRNDELSAAVTKLSNQIEEGLSQVTDILEQANAGLEAGIEAGNEAIGFFQGGTGIGMPKDGGLGEDITLTENITASDISVSGYQVTVAGQTATIPVLIKGGDGKVFSASSSGVIEVGQYDDSFVKIAAVEYDKTKTLTFSKNKQSLFGYDTWYDTYEQSPGMVLHYIKTNNKFRDAKAITHAIVDDVDFSLSGVKKEDLFCVNSKGFVYTKKQGNTLTLVGGKEKDAQVIYAVERKEVDGKTETKLLGALLLSAYPVVEKELVVVPTYKRHTIDVAELSEQVNAIYGKAGFHYTISLDNSLEDVFAWCDEPDNGCVYDLEGSRTLSNDYGGAEKKIRDYYLDSKTAEEIGETKAYLFMVNEKTDQSEGEQIDGRMNFTKQFGFIYNVEKQKKRELSKTIAHELGHGPYGLRHMHNKMYLGDAYNDNTYQNLMGYGLGTKLNKMQWDIIHEPGVTWGLFSGDKEQEYETAKWKAILLSSSRTLVYLNPTSEEKAIITGDYIDFHYSGHGESKTELSEEGLKHRVNGVLFISSAEEAEEYGVDIGAVSHQMKAKGTYKESEIVHYMGNYIIHSNYELVDGGVILISDEFITSLNLTKEAEDFIRFHQQNIIDYKNKKEVFDGKSSENKKEEIKVYSEMYNDPQPSSQGKVKILLRNGMIIELDDDRLSQRFRIVMCINGEKGVIKW